MFNLHLLYIRGETKEERENHSRFLREKLE
jgi:hypothetical protein